MRKTLVVALAAILAGACSNDSTGPVNTELSAADATAFGTALTLAGGYDAETYQNRLINALPDELALTDAQKSQIKSLVQAFVESSKADRDALAAILKQAHDAAKAGQTRTQVQAILETGKPVRDRLAAAEAKLKSDIDAVLTPEQRAWLAAHTPRGCRPAAFPPLTDSQKAQIRELETQFQSEHTADLDAVKAVMQEVQTAVRSGKSQDEIAQLLAKAVDPLKRLATARSELRAKILAILTPEQKASGCLPLG
jgi:Spy/CpxP family protein refolding chaperone